MNLRSVSLSALEKTYKLEKLYFPWTLDFCACSKFCVALQVFSEVVLKRNRIEPCSRNMPAAKFSTGEVRIGRECFCAKKLWFGVATI